MSSRSVEFIEGGDLVLRGPPNWTAVGFFAGMALLHSSIAVPAFLAHRWEGHLSGVLTIVFLSAAAVATRFRSEIAFLASRRTVRLRNGVGRFCFERLVPFSAVHGVRVTLEDAKDHRTARIELLCAHDDIECPPTIIPRQQALLLAMLLGVPLIKVSSGDEPVAELQDAPRTGAPLSSDRCC